MGSLSWTHFRRCCCWSWVARAEVSTLSATAAELPGGEYETFPIEPTPDALLVLAETLPVLLVVVLPTPTPLWSDLEEAAAAGRR
jgi:hypothetical protein